MSTLKNAAENFLKLTNIAIAGVSSTKKDVANYIYERLKSSNYKVFAINPYAKEVEGDKCYPDLRSVPDKVEGVIVVTHPDVTVNVVKECVDLGIKNVWIHRSVDKGSYSKEAEEYCLKHGINLIPFGCPMMFCPPVDFFHKCIKWVLQATKKMPEKA